MPNEAPAPPRAIVYCVVPSELADKLHEPLRQHFEGEPGVEVVVEQRWRDRRRPRARRASDHARTAERRRIVAREGRRVADRRATTLGVEPLLLPRRARPYAEQLAFVERLEPSTDELEDRDSARLVARFQAGDPQVFADLYQRYFDRVYGYFRVALRDPHTAEDLTQQVFAKVLEALPRYELRSGRPFRAWLFIIVRNEAVDETRRHARTEPADPAQLDDRRDQLAESGTDVSALSWLSDRELLMFVERLPLPQRQVITLRHMLGFSYAEVAEILGRSAVDVRALNSRGLAFLRARLSALGREASARRSTPMRRRVRWAQVASTRRWALHG